jgi:glycosyltransferase involved in cell wall biosynthesis
MDVGEMKMFNLEVPVSALGYGQMGWGIAYEIYKRGLEPNIFPIGNVDLRPFTPDSNFNFWLETCIKKALRDYRKYPTLRLWHIQGSERLLTEKTTLWVAHECDTLTPEEQEILSGHHKVLVTSNYSKDVFVKYGVNAEWCPNFFDSIHLSRTERQFKNKPITFGLFGKLEKRKNTHNLLVAWGNKYANQKDYRLIAAIFNPFIKVEEQTAYLNKVFNGRKPWNIEFFPMQETNAQFNELMNSCDINLSGGSGAEGWNLPCFNGLCLGQHSVVMNEHAHKDFATEQNSVLFASNGKTPIYDGMFFNQGAQVNQGDMFTFSQEDLHAACEEAVARFQSNPRNDEGEKLKDVFTVQRTVDKLLSCID